MAAKPASLGDFFNAKKKKGIKASNLNNTTTTTKPAEAAKPKKKDENEEGWEEEVAVAPTMKVDTAGKLMPIEGEKKDDDDVAAPVWGAVRGPKSSEAAPSHVINDRKFPSLAKSVQSTNINIDDGSEAKVNISTVKNHFAALEEGGGDDEEGSSKRPKEIKPAMVTKKKGERETTAIKREVDKYVPGSEPAEEREEKAAPSDKKKKKDKKEKLVEENDDEAAKAADEDQEDLKIEVDTEASKAKYKGRKKLTKKEIPAEELEEEKENRPMSKKKLAVVEDF